MITWDVQRDGLTVLGCGQQRRHWYLVTADAREDGGEVTAVRLTRWSGGPSSPAIVADEASRNVIVFPLGRGPGRPAGEPEVMALLAVARDFAERFDGGADLDNYPYWRHARTVALFLATGNANDCPSC